jgi:hypothetical protein
MFSMSVAFRESGVMPEVLATPEGWESASAAILLYANLRVCIRTREGYTAGREIRKAGFISDDAAAPIIRGGSLLKTSI